MTRGLAAMGLRLGAAIPPGIPRALIVRIGGRALVFVLALVLARVLSLEGFGIYTYATSWVAVLVVVGGLGYRTFLLRQTAIFVSNGASGRIPSMIRASRRKILTVSGLLVAGASIVAVFVVDPIFLAPLLVALPTVIVRATSEIWEGVLQGLGRVDESYVATYVVYPIVTLFTVGFLKLASVEISPTMATGLYFASFSLGALVLWKLTCRHMSLSSTPSEVPDKGQHEGLRELIPFTAFTLTSAIGATVGTIILGLFDRPDAVGLLQAAIKLTEPILVVIVVVNASLSYRIAGRYAQGGLDELSPAITRNVRVSFLLAVPIAAGLFLARDTLLNLFGADFEEASTALTILIPAVLFNVFAGGAAPALTMSRHVVVALVAVGAGVLLNAILCLILIPTYGANGAAVALAANIVMANGLMVVMAWRILKINTTALSFSRAS